MLSYFNNWEKTLFILGFLLLGFVLAGQKLTINYTGSIPKGLYYVGNSTVKNGDYTIVKDKDILRYAVKRGYIISGTFIGKKVVATKADTVCVDQKGVYVNYHYVSKSKPLIYDSKRRKMPKFRKCEVLTDGQVFVMGDREKSFDSRYFGPISSYEDNLVPLITYE